jgi:hypothetical protein
VVVHAPIENAEDSTGPYGYCPESAASVLFRFAEITCHIQARDA